MRKEIKVIEEFKWNESGQIITTSANGGLVRESPKIPLIQV